MDHQEVLTTYMTNFVDELICNGLEHVVISPGSRSTPLAMACVRREEIREWIIVDERSAAFFAIGLAKKAKQPVALVCTSGTAAANYFPAIVEAYYSDVPLLILTADRPHELRDVKAPQAIDQQKLYGDYVLQYHELALPEQNEIAVQYVRQRASASYQYSRLKKGPVHLNIPLREPLLPSFTDERASIIEHRQPVYPIVSTKQIATTETLTSITDLMATNTKGLIVVGPQISLEVAQSILDFASRYQLPVLADPLSQIRSVKQSNEVIFTYDAILRNEEFRKGLQPDYIIRFGQMPVSKMYRFFVEENATLLHFVISEKIHFAEETRKTTQFLHVDPVRFVNQVLETESGAISDAQRQWLQLWQSLENSAKAALLETTSELLTEGSAVVHLNHALTRKTNLFIANSMAVRDFDTFYFGNKNVQIYANRGANGIDGVISSAAGVGGTGEHVVLFIGDLSFYHDLNGLLTLKQYKIKMTIVLINNDGGGIFSFLPQRETPDFEKLFGTPLGLEFRHAARLYGAHYEKVETINQYEKALKKSIYTDDFTIIEIQTDRKENFEWHHQRWEAVQARIVKEGLIRKHEENGSRN